MPYLLDTNIVSAFINNVGNIQNQLSYAAGEGKEVMISIITHYEIRRGLLAVNAARKMEIFEKFCQKFRILFFDTVELSEKAAEIHTELKNRGRPIPDNDILIAATAFCHDLILVTNDRHFNEIRNMHIENHISD